MKRKRERTDYLMLRKVTKTIWREERGQAVKEEDHRGRRRKADRL